ncbi:MAG: hypothetical protein ABI640_13880 [Gammaproteobacteria bacterium]
MLDDLGFSPLAGITKDNVAQLQLVWSRELPPEIDLPIVRGSAIAVFALPPR